MATSGWPQPTNPQPITEWGCDQSYISTVTRSQQPYDLARISREDWRKSLRLSAMGVQRLYSPRGSEPPAACPGDVAATPRAALCVQRSQKSTKDARRSGPARHPSRRAHDYPTQDTPPQVLDGLLGREVDGHYGRIWLLAQHRFRGTLPATRVIIRCWKNWMRS